MTMSSINQITARREDKLRENSNSMTACWCWSSWFSGSYRGGRGVGEGKGCAREGVRLPSLSLTIYRGKGEEEAP